MIRHPVALALVCLVLVVGFSTADPHPAKAVAPEPTGEQYEASPELRDEINRMIRWLVPADGRANGIAHRTLVGIGRPAGRQILEHAFLKPGDFFSEATEPEHIWLPGTQANAARVLAEIRYVEALPVLKKALGQGGPGYFAEALSESIIQLERMDLLFFYGASHSHSSRPTALNGELFATVHWEGDTALLRAVLSYGSEFHKARATQKVSPNENIQFTGSFAIGDRRVPFSLEMRGPSLMGLLGEGLDKGVATLSDFEAPE